MAISLFGNGSGKEKSDSQNLKCKSSLKTARGSRLTMNTKDSKLWMFLPATSSGVVIDAINKIGAFILDILALLFGTTGAPIQEVIFIYILPFLLIYFTFYDFIWLMGFFRKRTAQVISLILALFGAHFGVYKQVVELIGVLIGTGTSGSGIWIPMLTFVFIIMALWWVIGQFLWGYKFATAIAKTETSVSSTLGALSKIGEHMKKLGDGF